LLLIAYVVLLVRRSTPGAIAAWHSPVATWIGRGVLFVTAAASGLKLVRDGLEILT
jgi:hypothetical protein